MSQPPHYATPPPNPNYGSTGYNTTTTSATSNPPSSYGSDAGSASSSSAPSAIAPQPLRKSLHLEDHVLVAQGADEETEDGIIRNRDAIRKIRDTWIYKQVRLRQDEFTNYRSVRCEFFCD